MAKRCIFCCNELNKRNGKNSARALEHVLKQSWLEKLGHMNYMMHWDISSGSEVIASRAFVAGSHVAPMICAGCNNGWMNELDTSVEHIVLSLAGSESTKIIDGLSGSDRWSLGRWLLKTAAAFIHTEAKDRRKIPPTLLRSLKNPEYLPLGYIAHCAKLPRPYSGVGTARLDDWKTFDPLYIDALHSCQRFHFGVQYDNVVFGCAFVWPMYPIYIGCEGIHVPIVVHGARINMQPIPKIREYPAKMARTALNEFLMDMYVAPVDDFATLAVGEPYGPYFHPSVQQKLPCYVKPFPQLDYTQP